MSEERTGSARADLTKQRTDGEQPRMSLDHGAESLVAMDNPDDSQLGAPINKGKVAGKEQ